MQRIESAEQIMGMVAQQVVRRIWTEAEFEAARDAAPPGERWELVDGDVLVTPSPHWLHQELSLSLTMRLRAYVLEHNLGRIFCAPLDVKLQPGLVTQPDILAVPSSDLQRDRYYITQLLLAAEILSPSSARFDRVIKRPKYQRNRVPEYWVVDRESRTFERWQPDDERPAILSEQLVWHPAGAASAFALDIPAYFAEAEAV